MPEDPQSKPKPARDPQALTSEYHKARKQLMLWAGILFVWQFIGIDLAKAEAMGGNIGAIVSAIKSPQAVPWVLLILVAYFLFKLSIEWRQCSSARRAVREARIDYVSAWGVALIACVLYAGQALSRVQLADFVLRHRRESVIFFMGLVVGSTLSRIVSILFPYWRENRSLKLPRETLQFMSVGASLGFVALLSIFLIPYLAGRPVQLKAPLLGIVLGIPFGFAMGMLRDWWDTRQIATVISE
jgi:hypothetical protein